jgi:simple sugar transport system ATP-binding protein
MTERSVPIEAVDVAKRYGDCVAVRRVSVRLDPGKIHALVGENGAGKSNLLKMMGGLVEPDQGEILVGGAPLRPFRAAEAIRRGVGLVHQHFALVETFTGLENLMLGVEPVGPLGVLRPAEMLRRAREVAAETGLDVPLDLPVAHLGVGERQRLEILRVLVRGARALLLDEPTAVLTAQEADGLYVLLRRVADGGATVAVVTHHLREVIAHADEVTVLRRGEHVHHGAVRETTLEQLTALVLGEIGEVPAPAPLAVGAEVLLAVRGLASSGGASEALKGVSIEVRRGEVVGVVGIDGNGQDSLVQALSGLERCRSGTIEVRGQDVTSLGVHGRRGAGVEVIFGDRHRHGVIEQATVHDNLVLGDLGMDDEDRVAEARLEASGAVPRDGQAAVRSFSGGNQQKLVVARALGRSPVVLVAAYPTRGVDAGACAALQQRIAAAAREGTAVLLVSADWGELRALCHRLVVLVKGAITAELPSTASEAELGRAMLGQEAS